MQNAREAPRSSRALNKLDMKTPDPPTETTSPFFKRDGLYYTSIEHLHGAEPLEIALHGITSDEQAHAAVQALLSNAHERGPKC